MTNNVPTGQPFNIEKPTWKTIQSDNYELEDQEGLRDRLTTADILVFCVVLPESPRLLDQPLRWLKWHLQYSNKETRHYKIKDAVILDNDVARVVDAWLLFHSPVSEDILSRTFWVNRKEEVEQSEH